MVPDGDAVTGSTPHTVIHAASRAWRAPTTRGRIACGTTGYRVGIIAQPDVQDPRSLLQLGKPELAVLISSGVVDSMVNHYTAALRRRSTDAYSAGGKAGQRPDRAIITYSHMVRRQLGSVPLIICSATGWPPR